MLGEQKEIQEVKNAYAAYEKVSEIDPYSIKNLKQPHGLMTKYVVEELGDFRLQRNLFITMCGRSQKVSRTGESYSWNSTVCTTVENFWGEDWKIDISPDVAYEKIRERILLLNPEAEENIKKFISKIS